MNASTSASVGTGPVEAAAAVFDVDHYLRQLDVRGWPVEQALEHYREEGVGLGLDPHPLFDTGYYLACHPEALEEAPDPFTHYLGVGFARCHDPHPLFDTEYYFAQQPRLPRGGMNALLHYLEHAPQGRSCNPNPLFGNGYYLAAHSELRGGAETPLAHYLRAGAAYGHAASLRHQEVQQRLAGVSGSLLARGRRRLGTIAFFVRGEQARRVALAARVLLAEQGLAAISVLAGGDPAEAAEGAAVVVEADVKRPSAVRLLAFALASRAALLATDDDDALDGARPAGVPSYLLVLDDSRDLQRALAGGASRATRVVFGSREAARTAVVEQGLANVAAQRSSRGAPGDSEGTASFVHAIADLARRDTARGSHAGGRDVVRGGHRSRRIVVPCPDWSVSGVNTALESLGEELQSRGWEIDLVFTRDRAAVEASAGDGRHMPRLPYRFLDRSIPGIEPMWAALIADVERRAPCTFFMAYDFLANSAVSALTDRVGAIMWLQADDGDYYEQAYRLGRYCNALVCVSEHIRSTVTEIHPGLGERAVVIHNTGIRESDVVDLRASPSDRLRIAYTGRLVQYQKRILDFIPLADALERRGVPFEITLIGTFPVHDEAAGVFEQRAGRHLASGRIRLPGRLSRDQIFTELCAHDFFVLLSDFEGLSLSLGEAMAAGCVPVVARMESGVAELVVSGENGLIVEGRDYERWAATIEALWRDPRRVSAMSEHARRTVKERLTVEHVADRFEEILSSVEDEIARGYERPPALHWGLHRSRAGDVLPPPNLYRPVTIAGLG